MVNNRNFSLTCLSKYLKLLILVFTKHFSFNKMFFTLKINFFKVKETHLVKYLYKTISLTFYQS